MQNARTRVRSDSPAIDKGVAQYVAVNGERIPPSPLTGFTGISPDQGWREFGAPIFPTPTPTPVFSETPLPTATVDTLTTLPTLTSTPGSPTPITETQTLSPTLTTTSIPFTITSTITTTPTPQLLIQSVDPNSAQANTTMTLIIFGSGFQEGALVTFEGGLGLPQEIVAVQVVNSTMLVVTMITRSDGTSGIQVWGIRVTNPDNSTTVLLDAFTVIPEGN